MKKCIHIIARGKKINFVARGKKINKQLYFDGKEKGALQWTDYKNDAPRLL